MIHSPTERIEDKVAHPSESMIDEGPLLADAQIEHGKSRAVLLGIRPGRVFGPEETVANPVTRQLQNTAQVFRNFVVTVDVDLLMLMVFINVELRTCTR